MLAFSGHSMTRGLGIKLSFRGFSNSSWLYPSPVGGVHAPPILSFNTAGRPSYYAKISSFLDNMPFQPARKMSSLISSTIFSTPLLPDRRYEGTKAISSVWLRSVV